MDGDLALRGLLAEIDALAIRCAIHADAIVRPDTLIMPRESFLGIRSGMWRVSKWEKRQRARRRRRFAHKRKAT